jgi:hypothetical protein
LDGSDPGSTTITPGHVVSIAPTRLQPWGISLGRGVAVANDGFASVNPSGAGRFPAYSAPNVFAPFNSNRLQMQIVAPANQANGTSQAATRGLGVMFLNVWQPNTTSLQYFSGTTLLYTAFAPATGVGQLSFVGVLFPSPVVTNVVISLGTATLFSFDGTSASSGPPDSPPSGNNLVAADDVVLAEPTSTQASIQGTAGVPVNGLLGTFTDTDPGGNAGDFTAVVNWGDGSQTSEPISGTGGTFSVSGSHTYTRAGIFQVVTTVTDFGGSTETSRLTIQIAPRSSATSVSCSPSPIAVNNGTVCTATVSDVGGGSPVAPMGLVAFSSPTVGSFPSDGGCQLTATGSPGQSKCSIVFIPTQFPPRKAQVVANYAGDPAHGSSNGKGSVSVRGQRCSIKLRSKRLAPHSQRLRIVVTCEMHADVRITIVALISHRGSRHPARISFGHLRTTVAANKPAKLRILISQSGLRALESAAQHRYGTSLELTVVGTLRSKPVKASETVRRLRFS